MADFKPGDVVVCVRAPVTATASFPSWVKIRSTYRVAQAAIGRRSGELCLELVGDPNTKPGRPKGWNATCFRKVDRASDEFTAQMRNLRPVKDKVNG